MKITLAQINTTPNDFEGNFKEIYIGITKAIEEKSDVIVFPELTIPGYLVRDLVYSSGFIENNLYYLQRIASLTIESNLTVIIGYIDFNHTGFGKPFRNMAAVIHKGSIVATYQKRLLPNYNIFEEGLYFEPGKENCVFEINGEKCALLICEDIWYSDKGETGNNRYVNDPIEDIKKLGINYVFCINSSPYAKDKPEARLKMLKQITSGVTWKNSVNLIYVNQIGLNDELVFDGHSCIISNGNLFKYLQTELIPTDDINMFETINVPTNNVTIPYISIDHSKDHLKMILLGLHDYVTKCGFKTIVLGSSGGIDSALVATLATLALGKENVNCIIMPSSFSSAGSVKDAKELHKRLGCNQFYVPIKHEKFVSELNKSFEMPFEEENMPAGKSSAEENIQARIRGQIIMYYSNAFNSLALTTGNKTELATGYTTLYGDSCGGFNPIGDLYKMDVYAIAKQINSIFNKLIPDEIINKAPSAELKAGQTDEASLLPYPILDNIVKLYIENYISDYKEYVKFTEEDKRTNEVDYYRIIKLVYVNEFKRRQAAPLLKLSKIAFGTGRRLPIVKKVML